jgi:hypothetical protein
MITYFTLWSNWRLKNFIDRPLDESDQFSTVLIVLGCYFLVIEAVLLASHTKTYLKSPWSYIKVIPMCLILVNAYYSDDLTVNVNVNFWVRQAFAGFFIWLRALYFMRSSEAFGYLIRIVIQVLIKISVFMGVLLMVVVGFADTFYSLSTSTKYMVDGEYPAYITSYESSLQYSYLIVLGEMPESMNDQDSLSWAFLITSTIITFIILSNMLIQIVSDIYNEVAERKYLYVYRERVELICDLQAFSKISSWIKRFTVYVLNR